MRESEREKEREGERCERMDKFTYLISCYYNYIYICIYMTIIMIIFIHSKRHISNPG